MGSHPAPSSDDPHEELGQRRTRLGTAWDDLWDKGRWKRSTFCIRAVSASAKRGSVGFPVHSIAQCQDCEQRQTIRPGWRSLLLELEANPGKPGLFFHLAPNQCLLGIGLPAGEAGPGRIFCSLGCCMGMPQGSSASMSGKGDSDSFMSITSTKHSSDRKSA